MTLRFLLSCCFGILVNISSAQYKADSLLSIIASGKPYAQRINAYLRYEEQFGANDPDKMLALGRQGIDLAIRNDDPVSIAELQRHAGDAFYIKALYDSAVMHYNEAINILEKTKEQKKLATVYHSLGRLYRKTRDYSRSHAIYNKALGIYTSANDSAGIANTLNEAGQAYEYEGNYPQAIHHYNQSLAIFQKINYPEGMAQALNNKALASSFQQQYQAATDLLIRSLALRKQLKDTFALALNYSDIAATYASSKNFEKARIYIDSSNALADQANLAALKQNNMQLWEEMKQLQKNPAAALSYYQKRAAIRDRIFPLGSTKETQELSAVETVKKEQRILEQQHRLSQQRIIITAGAIGVVLLGLLAYTQHRRIRWKQEARLQAEVLAQQQLAMKAVMQAEDAERARIARDLHDSIGQMLSAAKMNLSAYEHSIVAEDLEEQEAFQKIISLIDDSCKEVRTVSHNMMPNALVKNNLEAALKEFIHKLDQKSLEVHLFTGGLDDNLDADIASVMYRVIQECVNNVIRHAEADTLDISVVKDQREITATIEDNGKGFDTNNMQLAEGIGLKNIRTRIAYLKGSVAFESTPGRGTLVAIHVPL